MDYQVAERFAVGQSAAGPTAMHAALASDSLSESRHLQRAREFFNTLLVRNAQPAFDRFFRILFVLFIAVSQACIGSRHTVKFQDLEYPVSMTGQLYGSDKRVKADGVGLTIIGDVEVTRRYWSLLYSFVPLGDTTRQVHEFNRIIAARGAQGVIHFEIENEGCDMNNFALLVAPAILPFFPGCSKITFRGKLVRESK